MIPRPFRSLRTVVVASLGGLLLMPGQLTAGPLTPPPGPISPTSKPLVDVEPRTIIRQSDIPLVITSPGSYYLGEVVTPNADGDVAVSIDSDHVTLDLNGYTIQGEPGRLARFSAGVEISGTSQGVTVRNGAIVHADEAVLGQPGSEVAVEHLRVTQGDGIGITVASNSSVRSCTVSSFGARGISTGNGCLIADCIVYSNGSTGIAAGINAVLERCASRGNTGYGFYAGDGAVFNHCVAADNTGEISGGFEFGSLCTLTACVARNNTGDGFASVFQAAGSTLESCTAQGNTNTGFHAEEDSTIKGCVASGNSGLGFLLRSGTRVDGCSSTGNGGDGYAVNTSCIVTDSTARSNGRYGFSTGLFANSFKLTGCAASDNDDDGFHIEALGFDISRCIASGNTGSGFHIGTQSSRGRLTSCHVYDDIYNLSNISSNFFGPVEQAGTALQGNNPYINTLW